MMSVYDYVNEKLIKCIESGTIPWQEPWRTSGNQNPLTGSVYQGCNIFMTGMHNAAGGYKSPFFLSFKQVSQLGGQIIKGSDACMILFFKFVQDKRDPKKQIPFLKYSNVFNLEQTTLPGTLFAAPTEHININPFEFQYGYGGGPQVFYDEIGRAYYSPKKDEVHLPKEAEFTSENALKSTLFHELAHSTGHPDRLNRKKDSYAKEELVAEMAAAFMMHECGYEVHYDNAATYIKSWLSALADDKTLLVSAASKAEKAVKHMTDNPMMQEVAV